VEGNTVYFNMRSCLDRTGKLSAKTRSENEMNRSKHSHRLITDTRIETYEDALVGVYDYGVSPQRVSEHRSLYHSLHKVSCVDGSVFCNCKEFFRVLICVHYLIYCHLLKIPIPLDESSSATELLDLSVPIENIPNRRKGYMQGEAVPLEQRSEGELYLLNVSV